jgi:hypothetical protein
VHSVLASVIRLCILPEGHEERGLRASATKGQPVDLDIEHGTEHSRILTEIFEYMSNNVFLVNNADETMMEPFINALSFCIGMFVTLFNLCRLDFISSSIKRVDVFFVGNKCLKSSNVQGVNSLSIVVKIAKESTGENIKLRVLSTNLIEGKY